ncbi:uncharacterized protein BCR38DRAFT_459158 [Pseudomassariella vexata]|uniref:Uncharacterized protein n=1 Tax=Pseudomassariella vexata TaxID=1141098 RepID=A0A1Y2DPL2_9PEZI|nr:uncharacterized protein BCR38DRAFT_459158 [Pseudomassariella vexata]ORY61222.1 hypothetical protein BCR38DRAFT_459158 [Pseudomassariella vexata]
MQTVPSLIGTGTAVAAAATGLVFGQLTEGQLLPHSPTTRSNSSRRQITPDRESPPASANPLFADDFSFNPQQKQQTQTQQEQLPLSHTTNQPRIPRGSSHNQATPPKSSHWRHSFTRQGEGSIAENVRDSSSSNSSWLRRLSLRPLSQHESRRSSLVPDSPSVFSHGSGAPILSHTGPTATPLPPNKLVKRSSTKDGNGSGALIRRGSKSQMHTLRRPATSHQRSATLRHLTVETVPPLPQLSLDQQGRPRARTLANPCGDPALRISTADNSSSWRSYFHARVVRIASKVSPLRGDSGVPSTTKRVCMEQPKHAGVYLLSPGSIMAGSPSSQILSEIETSAELDDSPRSSNKSPGASPSSTPSKTSRRSMSMHFSSPTTWISKTGSIRRRKRGSPEPAGGEKRCVSEPTANNDDSGHPQVGEQLAPDEGGGRAGEPSKAETELAAIFHPPKRARKSSSPIPPLSRLSSFHVDLNQLGSSSLGSQAKPDEVAVSGNSTSTLRVNSNGSQARTLDRASTVGSSEYHRGFASGDDEDTDFKTDTPFDSFRTAGSSRRRTQDSPLESMFDESPPSTAGLNNKPKRLSIQEMLGPAFDNGHGIMEEDESLATPVCGTYDDAEANFRLANLEDDEDYRHPRVSADFKMANRDFGRLSFDDDDDLDWAREDEAPLYNHLSPPSSMNSRRGSPNLRTALPSISRNSSSELRGDTSSERPRSNVFDWAEPSQYEKVDGEGRSARPKTVHGKQQLDVRGGRSASRKGPTVAHIRSQSVPIVPDPAEGSKAAPKFGTWGLSTKNVSEDWDDDFEFEEEAFAGPSDKKAENRISMVVPASIQATQPTVRAHSGQIRELSLLVNDLKRLCRLGREMEILDGTSSKLWREAEGIIALASPDEDASDGIMSTLMTDDQDDRFVDEGFDRNALDYSHTVDDGVQIRTAVVRERPSVRRRSVFSPEDDIFGNWPHSNDQFPPARPRTPETNMDKDPWNPLSVARSLMESMQLRRRQPNEEDDDIDDDEEEPNARLNFDTNSLKELVKRASDLRDALSELIRKADRITNSPSRTPRREKTSKNGDGSPAFTRVFNDPASSPPRRPPNSHSNNSILSGGSINASPSNGLGQRMQMMTVS